MSEPASENVMEAVLEAWDEVDGGGSVSEPIPDVPVSAEVEPEEETVVEAEAEEADEVVAGEEDTEERPAPEQDEGDEEEEEAEPDTGEEEPEPVSFSTNDPAILAYLARYDNDPGKALKAAVELQKVLTRQGREKNEALARVRELETELEQAQMFEGGPSFLNEEQQAYVTSALESDQPQAWVMQAVRSQEFDLARAIADGWAEQNPYQAMRVSQMIDRAEQIAYQSQAQGPPPVDNDELFGVLVEHFPEMPRYEAQMVATLNMLGQDHPLTVAARSNDPQEKAKAIVSIYEIARASTATVSQTKQKVRQQGREAAVAARQAAVVSSSEASPSGSQTPRKRTMIAPGLSLEDLDAEFAKHSQ